MATPIDREILAGFVEEARGYLPRILAAVDGYAGAPRDPSALEEAHRLMHSIKGASSMVGLLPLSEIADGAEEALQRALVERPESGVELAAATRLAVDRIGLYLDRFALAGDEEGGRSAPARSAEPPEPDDGAQSELMEVFREEAADHLHEASRLLARLRLDPGDRASVQELRRRVHTLKGAAALVGKPAVADLSHSLEDLLETFAERGGPVSADLGERLANGLETLEDLVSGAPLPAAGAGPTDRRPRLAAVAGPAAGERPAERPRPPLAPPAGAEAGLAPGAEGSSPRRGEAGANAAVRVPLARIDELIGFVTELVVHHSVFERQLARLAQENAELAASGERLRRLSSRLESEYAAGAPAAVSPPRGPAGRGRWKAGASGQGFDPLELDRYTQAQLLARELAETAGDIGTVERDLGATRQELDGALNRLERLAGELQGRTLQLRMMPLRALQSRLGRTVRTTAEQQGKLVDLSLEGEETELDRNVLEKIADPLLHLLRNAVDHGIETPSERLALGKPARGTVRVSAGREGAYVVLQVEDDGAGIDLERVAEKAWRGGYLERPEAEALTPQGAHELLFRPGFSTAAALSQISGRGMGLDVVRSEVQKLKGRAAIASTPGSSTRVTLHLPLTLAVTRVLLVRVAGETVALPFAAVTRIARVETAEREAFGSAERVWIDGRALSLHDLAGVLGVGRAEEERREPFPVLVLLGPEGELALRVDELVEAREVVVKTLGSLLDRVEGVSGATLLGDGRVALILDPAQLSVKAPAPPAARPRSASPASAGIEVMVVDDSLSVRRVLSNLLRDAGWSPVTARDGVEALEILQRSSRTPDVILLDIEMPRMDGYELTATLRGHRSFQRIPIVMLTSRSGEKHRRKAFELGVTEYLVKPFEADTLLSVVRRLARQAAGALTA